MEPAKCVQSVQVLMPGLSVAPTAPRDGPVGTPAVPTVLRAGADEAKGTSEPPRIKRQNSRDGVFVLALPVGRRSEGHPESEALRMLRESDEKAKRPSKQNS